MSNSNFAYIENIYPTANRGQTYNVSYERPFKSELLANKTNFPDYLAFNKSDNLHYYKKPYIPELQPVQLSQQYPEQYTQPQSYTMSANTPKLVTQSPKIERFSEISPEHMTCLKHVLNCNDCKEIIQKNLGIISAQESNKEYIELISYITFSIMLIIILQNS